MKKEVKSMGNETICERLACEKGMSLVAISLIIVIMGSFLTAGSKLYDVWNSYSAAAETDEKLDYVQGAMQQYLARNGRYPCPASLTAAIDTGGYGVEAANCAGLASAVGRDARIVRTGAVPVRTLGIADKYSYDSYGHRLVYAVTEEYTATAAAGGAPVGQDNGAIAIVDAAGNNATSTRGNIVKIVYSMGRDRNGAFTVDGQNPQACDPTLASGENCDFGTNATFLNRVGKSENDANLFVHSMAYTPSETVVNCADVPGAVTPKDTAFLIDSSGSMASSGACPDSLPGCSRIDVARWAMRRVMPARIYNNSRESVPGQTSLTGFVGYSNVNNVKRNIGDTPDGLEKIIFDDPTVAGYEAPDDDTLNTTLETQLQSYCPRNSTPLGIHLLALADGLGKGEPDRPNRITIISDGKNTNGTDPIDIAKFMQNNPDDYGDIQVDVIDIVGNDDLREISQRTGGTYYRTDNPDDLLDALFNSAGACNFTPPTPPVDERGCGSSGSWGQTN